MTPTQEISLAHRIDTADLDDTLVSDIKHTPFIELEPVWPRIIALLERAVLTAEDGEDASDAAEDLETANEELDTITDERDAADKRCDDASIALCGVLDDFDRITKFKLFKRIRVIIDDVECRE